MLWKIHIWYRIKGFLFLFSFQALFHKSIQLWKDNSTTLKQFGIELSVEPSLSSSCRSIEGPRLVCEMNDQIIPHAEGYSLTVLSKLVSFTEFKQANWIKIWQYSDCMCSRYVLTSDQLFCGSISFTTLHFQIKLQSADLAGLFYGIKTLRQLFQLCGADGIPSLHVSKSRSVINCRSCAPVLCTGIYHTMHPPSCVIMYWMILKKLVLVPVARGTITIALDLLEYSNFREVKFRKENLFCRSKTGLWLRTVQLCKTCQKEEYSLW